MTTTLLDPRVALWERRKVTLAKLATLRMYRASMCGCQRCNDADRIEELDALIRRAVEAVDEMNNKIAVHASLTT